MKSTSSSLKRLDSLLHYLSKTGEQQPSPKRNKTTVVESEESESETETRPNTDNSSASAVDAGSSSEFSTTSESKQSRAFKRDWLVGRGHWLDAQKNGMFCLLCKKHNKQPFNCDIWNKRPCTRIRLQSIIVHEHCAAHKDSVKLEALLSAQGSIASAINPPVPSQGMEQAFSCLYFL